MVENINLNNVNVDDSGRVTFSGLTSGIDFEGAVESIIAARRIPIDRLEAKIEGNSEKITAFNDLRSLLNGFKNTLNSLRGRVTFQGAGNIFKAKEVFASSSAVSGTPSAAANLIGVSATNAAATGSHTIEVLQIAQAHKFSTATASSSSDDLGTAFGGASGSIHGSFEINGQLIEVQATDNLIDLADRINTANSGDNATGVSAAIVSVASNQQILVLTATATGQTVSITNAQHSSGLVADETAQLDSYTAVTGIGNTFEIQDASGAVIDTISYDETDTLETLQAKIDAVDGVSASIVADGSSFSLQIASDDGSTIQLANDSLGANGVLAQLDFPDDVLADLGISTDGGTSLANELRVAQTAKFRADGLIDTGAWQSVAVASDSTQFNVAGDIAITLPDDSTHNVAFIATDTPTSIAATINGDVTLQAAGISADVIEDDDGNFRLEIRQSALEVTDSGGVLAAKVDDAAVDALGIDGTMTFDFDNGEIAQIAVTNTDTLENVRDAINADLDLQAAGVSASIVATGSQFKLVVQHDATLAATAPAGLGLARPELIVERDSNTVDDLFTGLTISLFQAEVGTTIKLDVEQNLTNVKQAIIDLVDTYNEIKVFINEQQLVDPTTGEKSDDAGPLFGNSALASIEQALSAALGAGADGLSSGLKVLSQIGIEFTDNNSLEDPLLADTLEIDETILDEALLNNADGVRKLFAFDFSSSDPRVSLLGFTGSTQVADGGYTLDVTMAGGVITAATINGVAGSVTISGTTLTATDQTGANGLKLIYTGTSSASGITLDFSNGVAHNLYFDVDQILDSEVGTLETEVDNIDQFSALTQERIDSMLERLEYQRAQLLQRFIAMETALSSMNNTIRAIREQMDALTQQNS